MADQAQTMFRKMKDVSLVGTMAIYVSQAEASDIIPQQWRMFRLAHAALRSDSQFYGASPCTDDQKIHYLTGITQASAEASMSGERLTLEAGEYAVTLVHNPALLRDKWIWLLRSWLPASGRQEKNAPQFERFSGISEDGTPIGSIEIWIPLEPLP